MEKTLSASCYSLTISRNYTYRFTCQLASSTFWNRFSYLPQEKRRKEIIKKPPQNWTNCVYITIFNLHLLLQKRFGKRSFVNMACIF